MSWRSFKIFLVTLISFVMLYYSVAWALLRCVHSDADENYQVVLNTGESLSGSHLAALNQALEYLKCMGSEYHTEFLAASSLPSGLLRQLRGTAAHVDDSLPSSIVSQSQAVNFWLSAVFKELSSVTVPIHLPRYLSLSVLRL
jgi:hypothetical protein